MASPLAMEPAGFWRRVGATLIDSLILSVVQVVLAIVLTGSVVGFSSVSSDGGAALGATMLLVLFSLVAAATYESVLIYKYSATPGKMALGIVVQRMDGSPLSLGRSIGRYFAKIVSAITLYIGYLMVAFTSDKRGLHDMIADTRVVINR